MNIVAWAVRPDSSTCVDAPPLPVRLPGESGEPGVRRLGRTVTLYRDRVVEAIAGTRYSSLHPDREWIVVEVRMRAMAGFPLEIGREEISLTRGDGRRLALPDRDEIAEELSNIGRTMIAAAAVLDPLDEHLPPGLPVDRIPFATRSMLESIVLEPDRVAAGKLLFRAPRGTRVPTSYILGVTNREVRIRIPFLLPAEEFPPAAQ